jgi:hypothetical protein
MAGKTTVRFLLTVMLWIGWQTTARSDDFVTDERGKAFRVRFDPASQLRFGVVSGVSNESQAWSGLAEFELGVGYRSVLEFVENKEKILWQLDHRTMWGRIQPWHRATSNVPAMDLVLYSGTYLRHSAAPYMVIPTTPPKRMFFPFDIGVLCTSGRISVLHRTDKVSLMRLGVVQASVLLDPWRSGRRGNSLEFGLGVRYSLDLVGAETFDNPLVIHRVAPFTDTSVRFRFQDRPGLTVLDIQAHAVPHWATSGGWSMAAYTSARIERVLFAVNDEPVALVFEAKYDYQPATGIGDSRHDFRATAGLVFAYQLK